MINQELYSQIKIFKLIQIILNGLLKNQMFFLPTIIFSITYYSSNFIDFKFDNIISVRHLNAYSKTLPINDEKYGRI